MPVTDYISAWTLGWYDSAGGGSGVDMPSMGTMGWFEETTAAAPTALPPKAIRMFKYSRKQRERRRP